MTKFPKSLQDARSQCYKRLKLSLSSKVLSIRLKINNLQSHSFSIPDFEEHNELLAGRSHSVLQEILAVAAK